MKDKTMLIKTEPNHYFASCPKCLEDLLADEIKALGGTEIKQVPSGVYFKGSLECGYQVCLWSRTASRLFLLLNSFEADSKEALYKGARNVDWTALFDPDTTFAVYGTVIEGFLNNSSYAALVVKDAVADCFSESTGKRPYVETAAPGIRINVHIHRQDVSLSLDLSGDSLHKRGYRKGHVEASLKENVAAALLLRSGWPAFSRSGGALADPMCGAGTILIEGALMAGDVAPGLFKEKFGFDGWKGHDPDMWEHLLQQARERKEAGLKQLPPILGWDMDPKALRIARDNIRHAGLSDRIIVQEGDINSPRITGIPEKGLVATNPPYGIRIGKQEALDDLYRNLGRLFIKHFNGWKAIVITSEEELAKKIELRAGKRNTLYNGSIKCIAVVFDIEEKNVFKTYAYTDKVNMDSDDFVNRVKRNLRILGKWAKRQEISCYRLYDADIPEYAAAIDFYEGRFVHLQEYAPPSTIDIVKADKRLKHMTELLPVILDIPRENLFVKQRRRQKGKEQYVKLSEKKEFFTVYESGLSFKVNFADYLDTGIFLNNRLLRRHLRGMAEGKSFLNLFAYTGTATVYAAAGGASSTTTVDLSTTYLKWAEENMELNGFTGRNHQYIKSDCIAWLKDNRQKFDLIFLDPPTFSNTAKMELVFDLQKQHAELIRLSMQSLSREGVLIFSNNFKKFKLDKKNLTEFSIRDLKRLTLPWDFERNNKIHNCWEFRWM